MAIIDVRQDSVDVLRAENGILQRKLEVKTSQCKYLIFLCTVKNVVGKQICLYI
jgi:hypothetical protein